MTTLAITATAPITNLPPHIARHQQLCVQTTPALSNGGALLIIYSMSVVLFIIGEKNKIYYTF